MSGLRNFAIRWYRRVFGAPQGSDIREEGLVTVLDGNTAVALSEATITSHAVLGGSLPCAGADSVWLGEVGHSNNLFGEPLSAQHADGPRGIVAAATGLALAGRRATAFLSGTDIAAAQDLLISAAGKHAPLVLHLGTRAATAHGSAPGSGHETVHLSADSGFFLLFAANVQEAVDFTYVARRVCEESLVPGMVIMDGEQTALAPQDVRLLSPAQIDRFVGSPRQEIETPTEAQKLLFGETRRRVPAWYDLDEPALTGALFDKERFALGAFAGAPFFDAFVDASLADSFRQFAGITGRQYTAVSRHGPDDSKTALLAQGSAIETARVAADTLRRRNGMKAGVLGLHVLRPFPGSDIASALKGKERVFVLERADARLSGEPPLSREVRACLDRLGSDGRPVCTSVIFGVGGLPLRVSDVVELCTRADIDVSSPLFLGIAFDDTSTDEPKREALLDALRRAYPKAAARGVRATGRLTENRQGDAVTIAIERISGDDGKGLLPAAGALMHKLEAGRVRSRPDVSWHGWAGKRTDWLTFGNESLQDPGDDLVADITLNVPRAEVRVGENEVFRIPLDAGAPEAAEILLGGLFGALTKAGLIDRKPRHVIGARRALLEGVDAARREDAITAFQFGIEQLATADGGGAKDRPAADRWAGEAPATVRHLAREDNHFASLPRFWDQAGVLYREGRADRLTADPFLATGTMPPLSSTFSDTSEARITIPVFDPTLCTGCGKCWTLCPDSAIGVVAATPTALIDAAIRRSGADAVRQVSSKLATRIIAANSKADVVPPTFGELIDDAYAWLEDKMPLPDDRKRAIEDGIGKVSSAFGALPVAVTQPFFLDTEASRKDSAELLSIVINPEACKSCGLCVSSCEPAALLSVEQDAATLAKARELWSVFSATPDTASATVERVAANPDIGAMASILLSRYCQFALAGGDPAEAGSGEKMAVKLALAATEFHQQPLVQRFAESLAAAGERISALINETMSSTLAVDDLDAIAEQLKGMAQPRVDLKDLADSVGEAAGNHSVDTDELLRLIGLSQQIAAAHHRLVQGEHGLGRARYGLAVAGGSTAEWAGAFPQNPFQAPVLIDMTGDAAQLAAGLIEGHLRETTELVRLLRLADIEVDRPDGADWKREALARLRSTDLSREEIELCPPLVLVGSDEMLAGHGLGQLIWLLNSGLPVKVLVLSALDFGLLETSTNNPRGNLGLLALAQRNAYVAQTSVADPDNLGESMLQALRHEGPALIQVYAPSPTRHGFAPQQSLAQAELAVTSRALPLFRYDPSAAGVFGLRMSLDGNPGDGAPPMTLADWALGQQRFATLFEPLRDAAPAHTPLHEWLQLGAKDRNGKTPFVSKDEVELRYEVAPALADAAEACLQNWQTLQELAGIVTPFTERLELEIRDEVAAEHQAQLEAQKQAFDAEIREIEEKTQAEIANKIRSRLLQLATQKRG